MGQPHKIARSQMPIVPQLRSSTWLSSLVTGECGPRRQTEFQLSPTPCWLCHLHHFNSVPSTPGTRLVPDNVSSYSLASRRVSPMQDMILEELWKLLDSNLLTVLRIKVYSKQCFSDLCVLTNLLKILLKFRFWFRRSGVGPKSLHFWQAHDAGGGVCGLQVEW